MHLYMLYLCDCLLREGERGVREGSVGERTIFIFQSLLYFVLIEFDKSMVWR